MEHLDGFIGKMEPFLQKCGSREKIVLLQILLHDPSDSACCGFGVPESIIKVRNIEPAIEFFEARNRFLEKPAFSQAPGGLQCVAKLLLIKEGSLAVEPARFQGRRGRREVPEQLSKDIGGAAVPAQLHFSVGQLAIMLNELLPQLGRDMPEISRSSAEVAWVEIHGVLPEPPAWRGSATMSEVVKGNSMPEPIVRIGEATGAIPCPGPARGSPGCP